MGQIHRSRIQRSALRRPIPACFYRRRARETARQAPHLVRRPSARTLPPLDSTTGTRAPYNSSSSGSRSTSTDSTAIRNTRDGTFNCWRASSQIAHPLRVRNVMSPDRVAIARLSSAPDETCHSVRDRSTAGTHRRGIPLAALPGRRILNVDRHPPYSGHRHRNPGCKRVRLVGAAAADRYGYLSVRIDVDQPRTIVDVPVSRDP